MDTRLPPPQGAPPTYAFVTRVYTKNLRPVVMVCAFLGGLWTLFSGIGFFRNASLWGDNNESKLQLYSIILGALFMGVFAIELFGMFAAFTQKVPFVRIFAYLSGLVVLIIAATGLIQIIAHFSFKNDIIRVCTNATEGSTLVFPGFFGPSHTENISAADAASWCQSQFSRGSWSEIVSFLFTTLLAGLFAAIAFSFLRQVLDPTSPANFIRTPRTAGFPTRYNPPYGPPPTGAGGYPAYQPPAGPPPGQDAFVAPPYDADGKPPGYVRGDDVKDDFGDGTKKGYGWGDSEDVEGGPSERDVTSRAGRNPFI